MHETIRFAGQGARSLSFVLAADVRRAASQPHKLISAKSHVWSGEAPLVSSNGAEVRPPEQKLLRRTAKKRPRPLVGCGADKVGAAQAFSYCVKCTYNISKG